MHFSQDGIGEAERASLRAIVHCLQTMSARAAVQAERRPVDHANGSGYMNGR
jgi:hypothetical protein